MLVDLPSDKEDSKMVIIKSEPENKDRDDGGYRDGYRDGTVSSVENNGGNSGNSRCQVWTYEMSEVTSASAYMLCPFQTLVPRFQNEEIGGSENGGSE